MTTAAQELERRGAASGTAETRYRGVFDSATDGLLILDANGCILDANRAVLSATGKALGDIAGVPLSALTTDEYQTHIEAFVESFGGVEGARVEMRWRDAGDRVRELELRGVPFTEGHEARLLVVVSDVTERRRTEQRHAMLARKVLVAQEEERARISRELHDELGQLLTALRFELGAVQRHLEGSSEEARRAFDGAVGLVEKSAEELRHICKRLRPTVLDDHGLEPAVLQLIDEFEEWTGLDVAVQVDLDEDAEPLPVEVNLCAYRVLQEALTNVSRHSAARRVAVQLVREPGVLHASVYDDGRGFDSSELSTIEGSGMTGMRERANVVGGCLTIAAEPYQGTRVELVVPLPKGSGGGAP